MNMLRTLIAGMFLIFTTSGAIFGQTESKTILQKLLHPVCTESPPSDWIFKGGEPYEDNDKYAYFLFTAGETRRLWIYIYTPNLDENNFYLFACIRSESRDHTVHVGFDEGFLQNGVSSGIINFTHHNGVPELFFETPIHLAKKFPNPGIKSD